MDLYGSQLCNYGTGYPETFYVAWRKVTRLISGVVGNFLLWERKQGIMVTYPIVIGGGGGGGYKSMFKETLGGIFLDNGRYCNTSRLRCRSYVAYTAPFNFIARRFEGMLFREF